MLGACNAVPSAPSTTRDTAPATLRYDIDWDTAGVELATKGGWGTTTASGVTVQVERGWLVAHSAQLLACPHDHASRIDAETVPAPLEVLRRALRPRVAHAGHPDDEAGPTMHVASRVLDLARPSATQLGRVLVAAERLGDPLCDGHLVLAPASSASKSLPTTLDLTGASLHVEGTWIGPSADGSGNGEETPFRLRGEIAWGGAGSLRVAGDDKASDDTMGEADPVSGEADGDPEAHVHTDDHAHPEGTIVAGRTDDAQPAGVLLPAGATSVATATIRLAPLFDDVDWVSLDEEDAVRGVLRRASADAVWRVEVPAAVR